MRTRFIIYFLVIGLGMLSSCRQSKVKEEKAGPAKVSIERNEQGEYRLFVNGEVFYVKGAGLEFGKIETVSENGGNSFRTWRTENGKHDALEVLDKAHEQGLMVLMGLEVARERHGFDYNDTAAVQKQFEYLKGEVLRLKDHPALLAWAIGNELNLQATNMKVYDAVNDIAEMIHEVDPNHPTTTTTAGIGKREVDYMKGHCPELDFLSIQMYGDIVNLQQRINDAGYEGPYMVTEWGATGHWEVGRTDWNVPMEQNSREKAKAFINRYDLAIYSDKVNCMGSYVFLWGQKQERTPTWYGTFLENGAKTETVDAMHYIWTGRWPADRCPSMDSITLNGKTATDNIRLKVGSEMHVAAYAQSFENEILNYRYEILPESTDLGLGGDFETRPETLLNKNGNNKIVLKAPGEEGAYRLFVYVSDASGNAATANIPFYLEK